MVKQGYKQTEIGVIPEDWEVVNFTDEFDFLSTASYSRAEISDQGEIGYIHYGDIHTKLHFHIDLKRNVSGYINSVQLKTYSKVEVGDLIMADASEDYSGVGKAVEVISKKDNQIVISGLHTFLIRAKKSNRYALGFKGYFHSNELIKKQYDSLATGLKVYSLSKNSFKNVQIPLPPLPEQEAIAEALSDADAWIESLEQLIAKKRLIKQGAMQELLTPKDDWEVKKLGDIGKCLRGVSYSGDSDLFEADSEKSIKLLRSNNIYSSKIVFNNIQNVNKHKVKEHQIIQKSDILICMANGSKELVGKAGFCNDLFAHDKYTFGAFMGIFRIYENVDPYFIFLNFLSKNYRNFIDLLLSGSSINNLKPSDIEQIEIKIPSLPEQTRIATILSDMDAEIEALEQKLSKARQIKQGMMQELLTGRTRIV